MRLLATASAGLIVALLLVVFTSDRYSALSVASGALGFLSVVAFLLGFAPPALIRLWWRAPETVRVQEAIAAGVDLILLDNMSRDEMREAVTLAERLGRRGGDHPVHFEASGGLTLDSAASLSATGVDYAAVGALTHSAPALDLGLDVEEVVGASSEPLDRVGR